MAIQDSTGKTIKSLEQNDAFIHRHIGPGPDDINKMLESLGLSSLDELIESTLPASILLDQPLEMPEPQSEVAALEQLQEYADQNEVFTSLIGMGYYGTHVPTVILRNLLENPGWYTAYTPYQAEISQGRLESLLNFQQMVMDMTGMAMANASLLDEATAAAEAMALCKRAGRKNKSNRFFVADDVHPQTVDVVKTRAQYFGFEIISGPADEMPAGDIFGCLVQYPGTTGQVTDISGVIEKAHAQDALVCVASDLLALALLTPPGELGADIVFGSAQRFGVPAGFGGPHAAFFATRDEYKRSAPGRIIGVSRDGRERVALRMAMQTREQHIRRDKATSNICTAQALLANMAAMYAVYHGPEGIRTIATRVHSLTAVLASGLKSLGFELAHGSFFDTICVKSNEAADIGRRAEEQRINLRLIDENSIGISLDETTTTDVIESLWKIFAGNDCALTVTEIEGGVADAIPEALSRESEYLTHPVFNTYHSETDMLRYLKHLENRDFSLTHGMIPLGSCTMKLNATTEMIPVTWPGFCNLHPFAPRSQWRGYDLMIKELEKWLVEVTGYDAISMQPNSGAQGEYAGLLAIRRYHESIGQGHRNICLIPSSAHGTNPASASMMGLKVVVVKTDDDGNIDLEDLRAKAEQHSENVSSLMITYPSTHGVFEETVIEACDIVHEHGGQVYMDGANMNALVGVATPGSMGSDVSHLNLHKTFCIPHGGGGPGMGPIGVKKHLAPFLPNHVVQPLDNEELAGGGAVSAAPFGSAAILPISWAYIYMMGGRGLKKATQVAILNANYIAKRLEGNFEVLYRGRGGRVAHECIIDIRPIKAASGITEVDIAKRLMDYGFHAPTMSWPVTGTIMIEPTESEPLAELDRFCDAMLSIREEIRAVERGELSAEESIPHNAPHTLSDITDEKWNRRYPRSAAVTPDQHTRRSKFWPTVNRIDDVYGDRNFVCACPPLSAYEEDAGEGEEESQHLKLKMHQSQRTEASAEVH
ncbi:MAG: aminomethyl-transferring glycine dehydrogenase [Planctomycetota bacterium]